MSASWTTIATADIQAELSGPEIKALKEKALADGQTDPITPVVEQTIEEVRGYVATYAGDDALPTETDTIPTRLKAAAISVIANRIALRLPVNLADEETTRGRRAKADAAVRLFEKVMTGAYSITGTSGGSYGGQKKLTF